MDDTFYETFQELYYDDDDESTSEIEDIDIIPDYVDKTYNVLREKYSDLLAEQLGVSEDTLKNMTNAEIYAIYCQKRKEDNEYSDELDDDPDFEHFVQSYFIDLAKLVDDNNEFDPMDTLLLVLVPYLRRHMLKFLYRKLQHYQNIFSEWDVNSIEFSAKVSTYAAYVLCMYPSKEQIISLTYK